MKNLNVMLVHGAWADGSCWSKVILLLQAKGYNVTAAQIPLTSLSDDIAVTRRLLANHTEPTVLVGHSYGGAVITGAATTTPQVKALVYITAFALDEGESLASLSSQGPPSPGSTAIEPDKSGFLWINREKFHQAFVADATDDEAYVMSVVQKPLSVASFTDKEGTPAWKTIPSWFLVCTDDHMIPPPAQQFLAQRMKATVRTVAASHAAFIAKAQAVAESSCWRQKPLPPIHWTVRRLMLGWQAHERSTARAVDAHGGLARCVMEPLLVKIDMAEITIQ